MDALTLTVLAEQHPRAAVMVSSLDKDWHHATHCAECALKLHTRLWCVAQIKDEHICRWCGELLEGATWTP